MLKKVFVLTILLSLILVGTFAGSTAPAVLAQETTSNLLQNGDFEGNFVAVNGDEFLRVAEGWQPWNLPTPAGASSDINAQPEYAPAPPTRILAGSGAQQYDTFFATHVGGIFQQVALSQSGSVTFTVSIYPYSSSTFEDIDQSIEPQGVEISVGIDPDGGEDGSDPGIIWFTADEYYDEYQELSVTTNTTGTNISVWVRSSVANPDGLHQVFVDEAALTLSEGTTPTQETPTQAPTDPTDVSETPTQETPTEAPTDPTEVSETPTQETPTEAPTDPTEVSETPTGDNPTAAPREPYSAELPNEQPYVVEEGDTVLSIALLFNSETDAIIDYNGLSESGLIFIGQTLLIPVPANQGQPVGEPIATVPPGGGAGGGGEATPSNNVYVVQPGDNLFRIALRFGLTTEALAQFNGIINPARIQVGQEIRIPPTGAAPSNMPPTAVPITQVPNVGAAPMTPTNFIVHVVQPGENAFRIGLRYNVTWDVIAAANGLINPNYIVVGQQLIIPRY